MADKSVSAEHEKVLYRTQVQYLDEQLERLQLRCDDLTKQNQKLVSQISALQEDKKDICEYLQHSSAVKDQKAEELSERLEVRLQNDRQNQEVLELQLGQQKQKLQEEVELLQSDCRMQEDSVHQQQQQLVQVLSDLQRLKQQLEAEREEHEAANQKLCCEEQKQKTSELQQCWTITPDNLHRKMQAAVEEVKTQHTDLFLKVEFLLQENQNLWMERDSVERRTSELQRETNDMKQNLRLVTTSVNNLQQGVKKWKKRCQQLKVKVKKSSSFHQSMLDQEQTLRQNLKSVSENHRQKAAEMDVLKVQLKEEKIRRKQLEDDVMEAVSVLRPIVTDSETVPDAQQKLEKLKKILERTRSVTSDPTEEISREPKLQTAEPKPERSEIQNLSSDPVFLMARYRPGDFGFIPRPTWNLGDAEDEHQS